MLRRVVSVVIVVGATTALASPASATAPVQVRISEPATITLEAPDWCPGADVRFDVEQNFKSITFSGSIGFGFTTLTAGSIFIVATNLETSESVTLPSSGPGFIDADGVPIIGTGPWVLFNPGSVLYLRGRMEFTPSEFGVDVSVLRGTSQDICSMVGAD
jgi:hypothetical protein